MDVSVVSVSNSKLVSVNVTVRGKKSLRSSDGHRALLKACTRQYVVYVYLDKFLILL